MLNKNQLHLPQPRVGVIWHAGFKEGGRETTSLYQMSLPVSSNGDCLKMLLTF